MRLKEREIVEVDSEVDVVFSVEVTFVVNVVFCIITPGAEDLVADLTMSEILRKLEQSWRGERATRQVTRPVISLG